MDHLPDSIKSAQQNSIKSTENINQQKCSTLQYLFSLIALDFNNVYSSKLSVTTHFLPTTRKFRMNDQSLLLKTIPIYSKCNDYKMSAFVLQYELSNNYINIVKSHEVFNDLYKSLTTQLNQIFIAKPAGNFCFVCRSKFEDYLLHVNTEQHQIKDHSHLIWKDIRYLCRRIKRKKPNFQMKSKNIKEPLQCRKKIRHYTSINKLKVSLRISKMLKSLPYELSEKWNLSRTRLKGRQSVKQN